MDKQEHDTVWDTLRMVKLWLKVEFLQSLRSHSQLNYFNGIDRCLLELKLSPEVLKQERKGRFLSYPGKPIWFFWHYSFLFQVSAALSIVVAEWDKCGCLFWIRDREQQIKMHALEKVKIVRQQNRRASPFPAIKRLSREYAGIVSVPYEVRSVFVQKEKMISSIEEMNLIFFFFWRCSCCCGSDLVLTVMLTLC